MKNISISIPESLLKLAQAKARKEGRKFSQYASILVAKDNGVPLESVVSARVSARTKREKSK